MSFVYITFHFTIIIPFLGKCNQEKLHLRTMMLTENDNQPTHITHWQNNAQLFICNTIDQFYLTVRIHDLNVTLFDPRNNFG